MPEGSSSTTAEAIIQLTPAAAAKLQGLLSDKPGAGIRLGVVGGGCAGLQYQMDPADASNPEDIVQDVEGVRFFMHPMVLPYLKGITIDFSDALIDGGFRFINPNAASTCGCGTSFGI